MQVDDKGSAEQKMRRARTFLTTRYPFCASFVMEREIRLLDKAPAGMPPGMLFRACTDGRHIDFSRPWVEEEATSQDELVFTLAHEACHIAWGHHVRRGARCPLGWNIATDYVINGALRDDGYFMPGDILLDSQYDNMSGERVYDLVKQEMQEARDERDKQRQKGKGKKKQAGQGGDQGEGNGKPQQGQGGSSCSDPTCPIHQGQGGDQPMPWDWVSDLTHEDGKPLSEAEKAEVKRELEVEVQKAAQMERSFKQAGRGSAAADRAVKASRARVNWRDELAHLLMVVRRDDYTYQKPNRRYMQQGIYAPSLAHPSLGDIIVAVDTSGSIGERELQAFAAEIETMLQAYPGTTVHVVYCDDGINGTQDITVEDCPITLEAKGGGGTSFHPVFTWAEEQREEWEPAALIYLTDLCVYGFPDEPDYPVIWVSTEEHRTHPWGHRVDIDIHS